MNNDNKEKVRKIVEEEKWNIIWCGGDMPFFDEEVLLMYEDTDGQPRACEAIYTCDEGRFSSTPYFKRKKDGMKMVNCIAWKKQEVCDEV